MRINNHKFKISNLIFSLALISVLIGLIYSPASAQETKNPHNVYFPIFLLAESEGECQPNSQEEEFAQLMKNDPEQKRATMVCDPTLAAAARAHAKDMADRNYTGHVNLEGYGPNYRVWHAGYLHPYSIDLTANSIESYHAGRSTASSVWDSFMTSVGHRNHLLGLDPFYAEQTDYGIGYAYNAESRYKNYWVIITARK